MNQKGFAPLLIVLLIAAALGGYLIYNQQTKLTPPPQQIIQSSPSPSDETANWKTYTDTLHNYTIQYPPNWYLSEPSCKDECAVTISDTDLKSPTKPDDTTHMRLGILVLAQNSASFKEWHDDKNNVDVSKEELTTLAGIKGVTRSEVRHDFYQLSDSIPMNNTYINYKGKVYSLYYFPRNLSHISTLDKILSTFKFTQ